jgi:hypothetical protein
MAASAPTPWLAPSPDVLDPEAVPYFTWDNPVTNAVIRGVLATGPEPDRCYWMARILREARYDDVWAYVDLRADVLPRFEALLPLLGRRRAFWEFLIGAWRSQGVV